MATPAGSTTTPGVGQSATPAAVVEPPAFQGGFPGLTSGIELNKQLELVTIDLGGGSKPNGQGGGAAAAGGGGGGVGQKADLHGRKLLKATASAKQFLPGQPRIRLQGTSSSPNPGYDEVYDYLRKEHLTDALDELLPYMRYIFVQTPSFRHIKPLHHQQAHAREIKVNENPGLHLVWYYEKIFIKPIPAYFYSKAFWDYLKVADDKVYRACVGFMRSYYFLIQYEVDFEEGCKKLLIPKKPDGEHPTYEEFCNFMRPFTKVDDNHVSRRFHYGELRLTRINRTAFLFRRNLAYFHIYPQWGSFLGHLLAPIITIFAVFSVVLNSMQVSLAALDMGTDKDGQGWPAFISASVYFPIAVIIFIAIVLALALAGITVMGVKDFIHGNNVRRRKKGGDLNAGEKSHGMI